MTILLSDLKTSFRTLRRAPGFTAAVVLTLGLGIGANTAIFSVVNGVLLRRLPFHDPDRLVVVTTEFRGRTSNANSEANVLDYQAELHSLESVGAYTYTSGYLKGAGEPRHVLLVRANAELIPTLGINPLIGRAFAPDEDQPGARPVVVLSYPFWQQTFGGRSGVLGEPITIEGTAYTVIGVMPPGFRYPDPEAEAWTPLQLDPANPYSRVNHYLHVIGRLKPGVTLETAKKEVEAYGTRVVEQYPENYKTFQFRTAAVGLREHLVGQTRKPLFVLLGAVGFLLLIACVNVANLLLVRAEMRNRDLAIQSALGASWHRLASQLVVESSLLALAGGVLGLLLAGAGTRSLVVLAADGLPRADQINIDGWVLAFTLGVSLSTGLLIGLLPALRARTSNIQQILQQGGRTLTSSRRASRTRHTLVAAEVALAVLLLICASLMIRSLDRLLGLDPGFRTENVVTMRVELPETDYSQAERVVRFFRTLVDETRMLPGVRSAGIVSRLPLAQSLGRTSIQVDGHEVGVIGEAPVAQIQQVSSGYVDALELRLVCGRALSDTDAAGRPGVGLVNETFVRQHFVSDQEAIGKRIRMFAPKSPWIEIVGVVADTPHNGLLVEPEAQLYVPHQQADRTAYGVDSTMTLVVYAEPDAAMLVGPLRALVHNLDPGVPVSHVQTMADVKAASTADRAFPTVLLSVFGVVALVLAGVGVYAMVSFAVSQRHHEIGVRMAFGADSGRVRRMVVAQSLLPVTVGLAAGLLAAPFATDVLHSLLYEVSPTDPLSFAVVVGIMLGLALAASSVPAWHASRLDPARVLQNE